MKVFVDMKLCELHGQCEFIVPEVFSVATGELVYDPEPAEDYRERVDRAVRACPQLAIRIVE